MLSFICNWAATTREQYVCINKASLTCESIFQNEFVIRVERYKRLNEICICESDKIVFITEKCAIFFCRYEEHIFGRP